MDIKGVIVLVCLLHFSYATDSSVCLSKYNTCLSIFGLTANVSDPFPSEDQLYTPTAMSFLCSHVDLFVSCYDHMMTCLQLNRTNQPLIMTNAQLTNVVNTMCDHKTVLVNGHQCLDRINYAQITRECANRTQQIVVKLIQSGFSVQEVTCRSLQLSTECLYTSPALLSCGSDLVSALMTVSDASKVILCDGGTTTMSPGSIVG